MTEIKKYPKALIAIHWLTVLLFIVVFLAGKSLENHEFNEVNMNRYRFHALLGMSIMVLTVLRIFVKRKHKNNLPAPINYYSNTHKIIVNLVIKLIYILLLITPLVGFVMVFKTGALTYDLGGEFPTGAHFNETLETIHKTFVFSLLLLIVIHVIGVILYKLKTGENLIKRICTFMK